MKELAIDRPTLWDIRPIAEWIVDDAGKAFQTAASWEWFRRRHLKELVEKEGLIVGTGRRGDMATGRLTEIVREILIRESKAAIVARVVKVAA